MDLAYLARGRNHGGGGLINHPGASVLSIGVQTHSSPLTKRRSKTKEGPLTSKPLACCTAPPAVLDGGGSTSGFGDDDELLVRTSAVLKSEPGARKLAPLETRSENALVISLSITRTFASRCLSYKAN